MSNVKRLRRSIYVFVVTWLCGISLFVYFTSRITYPPKSHADSALAQALRAVTPTATEIVYQRSRGQLSYSRNFGLGAGLGKADLEKREVESWDFSQNAVNRVRTYRPGKKSILDGVGTQQGAFLYQNSRKYIVYFPLEGKKKVDTSKYALLPGLGYGKVSSPQMLLKAAKQRPSSVTLTNVLFQGAPALKVDILRDVSKTKRPNGAAIKIVERAFIFFHRHTLQPLFLRHETTEYQGHQKRWIQDNIRVLRFRRMPANATNIKQLKLPYNLPIIRNRFVSVARIDRGVCHKETRKADQVQCRKWMTRSRRLWREKKEFASQVKKSLLSF